MSVNLQPGNRSSPTTSDAANENEEPGIMGNGPTPTCSDFTPFWSTLLDLSEFKELNTLGVHVTEKKKLAAIVYDAVLCALVRVMKKLELGKIF